VPAIKYAAPVLLAIEGGGGSAAGGMEQLVNELAQNLVEEFEGADLLDEVRGHGVCLRGVYCIAGHLCRLFYLHRENTVSSRLCLLTVWTRECDCV